MNILYVASEAAPYVATGGLADVAGSLPGAVHGAGHDCRVVLPLYSTIKPEQRKTMKFLTSFYVPLGWRNQYCGVFEAHHKGVVYYFLDNEYYFKREGKIYGYFDDAERFAFFSKAAVEMLQYIDFAPQVLHCNDWQSAMVPVYLNLFYRGIEKYSAIKTVFTIHNIQYQGKYGPEIHGDVLGLPQQALPLMMYDDCINMMKAAIECSDKIGTVSPTYAKEILDPWFAHGMDRILQQHEDKLIGILNGIDTESYNPNIDPQLYQTYDAKSLKKKAVNKVELQKAAGLEHDPDKMLLGIVSRFVAHKGIDLIQYIYPELMERELQVVVLGSGDYLFEKFFLEMQTKYAGKTAVKIGFIPEMARKIYAGADVFLMPSKSEPCGLAQMVAMRYGTLPIVRETGGLKDSVRDMGDDLSGNGFTFQAYNAHDMLGAIDRASGLYYNRPSWKKAVEKTMAEDFSWKKSARQYVLLYQQLIAQA